jgi:quinoprotein glucose dehydrogenase
VKKALWITVVVLAVAGFVSMLGGSLIWYYPWGDIDELTISGHADTVTEFSGEPWSYYGGDAGGMRFVDADIITPENVSDLTVAWRYQTGNFVGREEVASRANFQVTPILVNDSLIFCTPFNEIIALDPGTGEQQWKFDAQVDIGVNPGNGFTCRGVALHQGTSGRAQCNSRIFMGTVDSRLIAIDATTGEKCEQFGVAGEVKIVPEMELQWPGEFQITSAPVVAGDIVVVGSAISDNNRVTAPAGTVRAYDAETGEPEWAFDPVPRKADSPAAASWQTDTSKSPGHANVWSSMSYDRQRDLLFLPTSSPSPDFFGGLRPGINRYANSVVALRGETGEVVWDFQTVHHDVWDYDVPAQPGLYSITRANGDTVDVVAQATKTGLIFVLDRETGEPVIPVEETPVPQDGVAGEFLSPTQPMPVRPAPIVPNHLTPDDAFGVTLWDRLHCKDRISAARSEGLFTPPSLQGTILYPFTGGGANWGSTAFDPTRNLLVVNMSNIPHLVTLVDKTEKSSGAVLHEAEFAPMHGAPYGMTRETLLSPLGLPCSPPPWGVLAGVDLNSGNIVWRKIFGSVRRFTLGLDSFLDLDLGMPSLGGPLVTASGLIFIAATVDDYIRAFDTATGTELWEASLPASGQATPMSYLWQGRQYVVIAAGGHKDSGLPLGDTVMAFALPR